MCEDARSQAANVGNGAPSVPLSNLLVEQLVAVVWLILDEGAPGEMGFEVVVPNLSIPGDGGRFEAPFHCRQVNLCPIVGDEGVCSGWLGFGLANSNHVLITKCKHGAFATIFFTGLPESKGITVGTSLSEVLPMPNWPSAPQPIA